MFRSILRMSLFSTLWLFIVGLPGYAQPDFPGYERVYYVNYWSSSDWKKSDRLLPRDANSLGRRLQSLGAEVRYVPVGVTPPPGTFYPDPNDFSIVVRVQYRLLKSGSVPTRSVGRARIAQEELRRYGFEVKMTVDAPMQDIPESAREAGISLPSQSVWRGVIEQQDHSLPAKLELTSFGDRVEGTLSFTFQKYNYLGKPTETRSYRARVEGRIRGDTLELETTKAIQGNVYLGTVYKAKLKSAKTLAGQWDNASAELAGDFSFTQANR